MNSSGDAVGSGERLSKRLKMIQLMNSDNESTDDEWNVNENDSSSEWYSNHCTHQRTAGENERA
ncbi:hypothetical protein [Natrialba taiwanensis]|uniref:hypothetical protein n=1 Tax=Natrialba taiwanensis TaxID=160846 RepID=UPI001267E767|nr:hypothetical protein [Natrialba taiwanensis]